MDAVWIVLLFALGGLLIGGTVSMWSSSRIIATVLAVCAVLALAAGALRMVY